MADIELTTNASLTECEAVVEHYRQAKLMAGKALMFVRDRQLYRPRYRTFEEYLHRRWDFSRSYAYNLISGAEVVEVLVTKTDNGQRYHGNVDVTIPTNARVAREMAPLRGNPDEMVEVWREAKYVATTNGHAEPSTGDVQVAIRARALGPVSDAPTDPEEGSQAAVNHSILNWKAICAAIDIAIREEQELFTKHDLTDNQRYNLTEEKRHAWMRLADEF